MFTNLILKECQTCNILKPLGGFHKHKGRKFNVTTHCAKCRNRDMKLSKYKLVLGQKELMLKNQEYKCCICKNTKDLVIDHSHNTGNVRGLLCNNCNMGLGQFKDDVNYLNNAIKYLEKNNV